MITARAIFIAAWLLSLTWLAYQWLDPAEQTFDRLLYAFSLFLLAVFGLWIRRELRTAPAWRPDELDVQIVDREAPDPESGYADFRSKE